MIFNFFFHYSWFIVFCHILLYSMVTQLHIHVYILFSHIIMHAEFCRHRGGVVTWQMVQRVEISLEICNTHQGTSWFQLNIQIHKTTTCHTRTGVFRESGGNDSLTGQRHQAFLKKSPFISPCGSSQNHPGASSSQITAEQLGGEFMPRGSGVTLTLKTPAPQKLRSLMRILYGQVSDFTKKTYQLQESPYSGRTKATFNPDVVYQGTLLSSDILPDNVVNIFISYQRHRVKEQTKFKN